MIFKPNKLFKPVMKVKKGSVRDRFWSWSHEARVYDNERKWNLPKTSRITPVEGAYYMGIPNIIFVRYRGKPKSPFEQCAIPFKTLKRVNWSITGAVGETSAKEREHVFRLARSMPNITGVFMDDFFNLKGGKIGALSVNQLESIRKKLNNINGRKLDLGVTLYTYQLDRRIMPHLKFCDVISLWTWEARHLKNLKENFKKLNEMIPNKRIWLGCYMWDFGVSKPKPMSIELMKMQCELGLKWLKEGRIEGMIFLGTNICDRDINAVEWTREWIAKVGDKPLKK
jgi:hypothetical protein